MGVTGPYAGDLGTTDGLPNVFIAVLGQDSACFSSRGSNTQRTCWLFLSVSVRFSYSDPFPWFCGFVFCSQVFNTAIPFSVSDLYTGGLRQPSVRIQRTGKG